mmetsp:Transcript_15554/g.25753  ORF Transcript_15554/g.25753 Transcript_15554/m.25753 type:complete len:128 (+) Transcript_15554:79-462(+)
MSLCNYVASLWAAAATLSFLRHRPDESRSHSSPTLDLRRASRASLKLLRLLLEMRRHAEMVATASLLSSLAPGGHGDSLRWTCFLALVDLACWYGLKLARAGELADGWNGDAPAPAPPPAISPTWVE